MTGSSPRGSGRFSRTPPFMVPGLIIIIVILGFNYWRSSRLNKELLDKVAFSQAQNQKLEMDVLNSKTLVDEKMQKIGLDARRIDQITDEKEQVRNDLSTCRTDFEREKLIQSELQHELDTIKSEITERDAELTRARGSLSDYKEGFSELNKTCVLQGSQCAKDAILMLSIIGEWLGRDKIEELISHGVALHDFQPPPHESKPKCSQPDLNAVAGDKVVVVEHRDDKDIESPHINEILHQENENENMRQAVYTDAEKQQTGNQQAADEKGETAPETNKHDGELPGAGDGGLPGAGDALPADAAPSNQESVLDPNGVNTGAADGALVEGAPADGAPADGVPADGAPADGAPADGAPADGAPADGAPADGAPADGALADGAPADGVPADEAPAGGLPGAVPGGVVPGADGVVDDPAAVGVGNSETGQVLMGQDGEVKDGTNSEYKNEDIEQTTPTELEDHSEAEFEEENTTEPPQP